MIRQVVELVKLTIKDSMEDNTSLLAAAIAFYTLLSLAPALLVIVAVAGAWFGRAEVQAEIVSTTGDTLGPAAAEVIRNVLQQLESHSSAATIAGVISMFFGATVVFGALQDSLNRIWQVEASARGYIKDFFMKRLVSFLIVLVMGAVLFASLVLAAVIAGLSAWVPQSLPVPGFVLQAANFAISFALMTLMFAAVYKILPDAWIRWRDVWVGATVTSLLFTAGKTLIALYLGQTTTGSPYGAAGSLVVFLLWIYYSAQIFLLGAEFTEAWALAHGSPIVSRAKRRAAARAAREATLANNAPQPAG
jgi:membrane protein